MVHSRRTFLAAAVGAALPSMAQEIAVVDIHQHTPYTGRSADQLLEHQKVMGIAKTILLPAGRAYSLAAGIGGNEAALALVKRYPGQYYFFANELPDISETRDTLEKYLKQGAIGIGEQKFHVDCDSNHIDLVALIARDYGVPVLLHFEYNAYNLHFTRFHKVLERHPKTNFIGHAQTWWANIDAAHDQTVLYPRTRVRRGGYTTRLLQDYPNMYADLSAGSGLNAMRRDEEHAQWFLDAVQDKLLYGSDCSDRVGKGDPCSGWQQLELVRRLAPNPVALRKILAGNALRIMRLG
jgi:uncharacterized protein